MALALFDLDNTLLGGDSDYLWGRFLAERNIVDDRQYQIANERFYREYEAGILDIQAFLAFALKPLTEHPPEQLEHWHRDFMQEKIEPIILPDALDLVAQHRHAGDTTLIITATNSFVTAPIARRFGVDQLLATEPERVHGRYSGRVQGIPCFQDGKVKRLQAWMDEHGHSLVGSHFYSDSRNDLPLLELVSHPVAVDPDPVLRTEAERRGWPVISLRRQGLSSTHSSN